MNAPELVAAKCYVQSVIDARFPRLDDVEREEVEGDGLEFYVRGLRGRSLGNALIDRWRERHPGSRSASAPPPPQPLPDTLPDVLVDEGFQRRLESYQAALILSGEADLGDSRLMGKLADGVPSAAVVPTAQREGVWDSVQREREEFGQIFGFEFRADDDLL